MKIAFKGWVYLFRKCDVNGHSREEITEKAMETGEVQYQYPHVWLHIPGIGYGLREWIAESEN